MMPDVAACGRRKGLNNWFKSIIFLASPNYIITLFHANYLMGGKPNCVKCKIHPVSHFLLIIAHKLSGGLTLEFLHAFCVFQGHEGKSHGLVHHIYLISVPTWRLSNWLACCWTNGRNQSIGKTNYKLVTMRQSTTEDIQCDSHDGIL